MRRSIGVLAAALLLVAARPAAAPAAFRRFTTSDGVTVAYPADWRRHGDSRDRLLALSPGAGAEGVVIAHGQAMVAVMTVGGWSPGDDLGRAIVRDTGDANVLARRQLVLPPPAGTCSRLSEVDTSDEVAPGAPELTTNFYCVAAGRLVGVSLTYWPDDPKAPRYRRTALQIAASISLTRR